MSDRLHNGSTPEGEYFETGRFAGLSVLLGVIAFVALALCGAGAAIDPKQLSFSWLFAFGFFFTLCAGCFFWTIVHYATDAEWTVVVRRQLENIAVLFAVLAILFIPILLLRHHLYEWMNIAPGKEATLDSKRLPEFQLLHPARRFLPRILHHRVAVVAPIFSAAGQGRQSAIHHSP